MVELTLIDWLVYAGLGRIVIFLGMQFVGSNIPRPAEGESGFFWKLFSCDLCLGVWVYSLLALIFNINAISVIGNIPVINSILTGMFTAFVIHIFSIGWRERFGIININ